MIREEPFSNVVTLKSLAGNTYQHFAKTGDFNEDLYHNLVAPGLHANLLTETWQHNHKTNIGPSCDGNYTVLDITDLNVQSTEESFTFYNRKDHSKFAVSSSAAVPYVCIGDINREV